MKINLLKVITVVILLISCCCFAACADLKYPSKDIGKVFYVEPDYIYSDVEFDSKLIELKYADLIFDVKLSNGKINRFVKYCEELLNHLKPEEKLVYYISPKLYTSVDVITYFKGITYEDYNDKAVYFNYSGSLNQLDLITYTLMAITPSLNSLNYGLVYGMSCLIESNLGWKAETYHTEADTVKYITANPNTLDMEHPQFLSKYSTAEEIAYVKSASYYFANYLYDSCGRDTNVLYRLSINSIYGQNGFEELIHLNEQSLFDKEFPDVNVSRKHYNFVLNDYKNSWLESVDCPVKCKDSSDYYFTVYARQYPFIVRSNWMNYFISFDFKENYLFFNFDYAGLKNFLLTNEEEMNEVRGMVDYTDQILYKTDCYFVSAVNHPLYPDESEVGGYVINKNTVCIKSLAFLIHEYTHSVTLQLYYNSSWMEEGFARYCEFIISSFSISLLYQEFLLPHENEFEQTVINAYQLYSPNEFIPMDYLDMYVYVTGMLYPNFFHVYNHGASLTNYLINVYGKDLYLCAYKSNADSVYGKTFEEIKAEWMEYLSEKFSFVNKRDL